MKYFLLGKNITRINKIFNRYFCKNNNKNIDEKFNKNFVDNIKITQRILKFLSRLVKCMKLYGYSIRHHKVLKRFSKNLLEHINNLNIVSKNNENRFREHLTLIVKIFYNLSKDYDYEEYEKIKYNILNIFRVCPLNLLDNRKLVSFYKEID